MNATPTSSAIDARLDVSFVLPWLAIGAAMSTAAHLVHLRQRGLTHILDCRTHRSAAPPTPRLRDVVWTTAPTADDGGPRGVSWYQLCIDLTADVDPTTHVLYVHCAHGVNRAPAAAFVILRSRGWTSAGARKLIQRRRPAARPTYFEDADEFLRILGRRSRGESLR